MRVAVLTLTRDRLGYTRHCFERLTELSGVPYDHYVLDQGSEDGTPDWLMRQSFRHVSLLPRNLGIVAGVNYLLTHVPVHQYDVIVKVDNDCELTQQNTLRDVCQLVMEAGDALLSPRILGLRNPPAATGEFTVAGETILDIPQIGGIFLAVPASIYTEGFRYDESNPAEDDVQLCWWWRGQGGRCGYVKRLEVWHYETTDGQWKRHPEYFRRRVLEGGRAW